MTDLTKGAATNERVDVVTLEKLFAVLDDVIVILVVESVVVKFSFFLSMMIRFFHLRLKSTITYSLQFFKARPLKIILVTIL